MIISGVTSCFRKEKRKRRGQLGGIERTRLNEGEKTTHPARVIESQQDWLGESVPGPFEEPRSRRGSEERVGLELRGSVLVWERRRRRRAGGLGVGWVEGREGLNGDSAGGAPVTSEGERTDSASKRRRSAREGKERDATHRINPPTTSQTMFIELVKQTRQTKHPQGSTFTPFLVTISSQHPQDFSLSFTFSLPTPPPPPPRFTFTPNPIKSTLEEVGVACCPLVEFVASCPTVLGDGCSPKVTILPPPPPPPPTPLNAALSFASL